MTRDELKELRHRLGLSVNGLARLLRMQGAHGGRTVQRWEAGEQDVPGYVALVCELVERLPAVRAYLGLTLAAGDDLGRARGTTGLVGRPSDRAPSKPASIPESRIAANNGKRSTR